MPDNTPETSKPKPKRKASQEKEPSVRRVRVRGGQKGNRNAAKVGEDLRVELYLSKIKRGFFEEWFEMTNGRKPYSEDELREAARKIATAAIDRAIVEEFEKRQPGRTNSGGEVF